jgi:hypothetical protein
VIISRFAIRNFGKVHPMKVLKSLSPPINIPVKATPSINEITIYFPVAFFTT